MAATTGWRLRTYPLVVLVALGLAVLGTVLAAEDDAALTGQLGGDLPEFVGAGRIVAAGDGVELYDPDRQLAAQSSLWPPDDQGGILYAYPAALAGPYAAVDSLDYRVVYLLHTAAMVAAAVIAVRLLVGRLPALPDRRLVPLALAVALTFLPMFIGVFNGQTTALVLLLVVTTWVALQDGRDVVAGVAAGLLLVKPQYGLVVIGLLVLARRGRAVAAAALAGGLLWVVSAVLAGPGWLGRWWELVRSLSDIDDGANLANEVSPLGLAELVWGQGSGLALGVGLFASALVGLVLVLSLRRLEIDDPRVPALVLPSLVLVAPHSLYYDAGLLLVSLAALLPLVDPRRRVLVAALWWCAGLTHLLAPTLGVEPVAVLVVATWTWAVRELDRTGAGAGSVGGGRPYAGLVTHYEVLGVSPRADAAEIRAAYVRLARHHHPDRHTESPAADRVAAERRMQAINAAFRELGDSDRRRRYDQSLRVTTVGDATIADESPPTWRPYDDGWEVDLDDEGTFGEAGARRPTGARLLAILPVSCLVGGVGTLVVGAMVGLGALVAVGIVAVVLSFLLFVLAPLAVVLESRRHDGL